MFMSLFMKTSHSVVVTGVPVLAQRAADWRPPTSPPLTPPGRASSTSWRQTTGRGSDSSSTPSTSSSQPCVHLTVSSEKLIHKLDLAWDPLLSRIIDSDGAELGQYCGTSSPPSFNSVTNKLTLEFTSDVDIQAGGFEAEWTKVPMSGNTKVSQG